MTTKSPSKLFIAAMSALAGALVLVAPTSAQTAPSATGGTAPPPPASMNPNYPIPYRVPTPESIKTTLDAVRGRLDAAVQPQVTANGGVSNGEGGRWNPMAYPFGVIQNGMLLAAETTGDKAFSDFAAKWFQFYSDHLPAAPGADAAGGAAAGGAPPAGGGRGNPFAGMARPSSLDSCGAMGESMIKANIAKVGPNLRPLIDRYSNYVHTSQFRLDDGTLARTNPRPHSLWADDMYMGIPILAWSGKLTGDTKYYDDAIQQVKLFTTHMFIQPIDLYTHGWNVENADDQPSYFWGRANGWCMMAMAELLEVLPPDYPGRADVLKQFRTFARGVATQQSNMGLWHQLLDRQDSYLETSCSAMFVFSMARGVNRGWLDAAAYGPVAIDGWNGLTTRISAGGAISGTCVGTNQGDDYTFYYNRPAPDDIHGYGPVLLAGSELYRMLHDGQARFSGGDRGGSIQLGGGRGGAGGGAGRGARGGAAN